MTVPGPHDARGLTSSVVDALRGQPMTLALIVIVILFAYFSWSGISAQRAQTHEILKILLDRCGPQRSSNSVRHLSPVKSGEEAKKENPP